MPKFELPAPEDDGLFIPDVKAWSADKHHFLRRYMDAFTQAMKAKAWDSLHYIDLFAGAGIERVEDKGLDWGSPLIAAQLPVRFHQLHLVDSSPRKLEALTRRLQRFQQPTNPQLILGDANKCVGDVISQVPSGALSLAFLDPYGLHLHYETLKTLAQRRVDFVIFFPDHIDALRNHEFYYKKNPNSKLTQVLGTDEWEPALAAATPGKAAEILNNLYVAQIRVLGYDHFDYERIERPDGHPLYRLISCSRDKVGGKIWRGITQRKPDGQGSFDFESYSLGCGRRVARRLVLGASANSRKTKVDRRKLGSCRKT